MSGLDLDEFEKEGLPEYTKCPKCDKLDRIANRRTNPELDRLQGYRLLRCNRCKMNYTQWFNPSRFVLNKDESDRH